MSKHFIPASVILALSLAIGAMPPAVAEVAEEDGEEEESFDPRQVRRLAREAGLRSLREVEVPEPENLDEFLRPGDDARQFAIQLGKALFWDMQVGSDGQACGTCHFHAGADSRTKNQLSPGLKHTNEALRHVFQTTASGAGGPNYDLTAEDFPFHRFEDPEDRMSPVTHDTDDVCSSQGVFNGRFTSVMRGRHRDLGTPFPDDVFNVGGVNVRRVEPRNTPTMINAVFNFANFWDGRAHNVFNGATVLGPLDANASILVNEDGALVRRTVRIDNSSLASQAVGPPGSDLEMSFFDRPMRDVGRKLLGLRPLNRQLVHPKDSVLGPLSRARLSNGRAAGKKGLSISYAELVKRAFRHRYWSSSQLVDGYSQLEHNFGLFLGLSIQLYETTLVSDNSDFDEFMEGDDDDLDAEQLRGLLTFINRGPERSPDPLFGGIGHGNCVGCHGGAEFTDAAVGNLGEEEEEGLELIELEETPELVGGVLGISRLTTFLDNGFSNIGVRPSFEDLGRGGIELGVPLSFVRQRLLGLDYAPELPECGGADELPCPDSNRVAVDGAFKVPGLRNVELTGPYFHNGGQATLSQVVEFYDRQGDFSNANLVDVDRNLAFISLDDDDEEPLVRFLLSLTDERVRNERAPFDHPQLFVPNGHAGDHGVLRCIDGMQACDDLREVRATGADGRRAVGLKPVGTFLGLEHLDAD